MDVLCVGIFFTGIMLAATAAIHAPKRKVKWGDEKAPRVVTKIHVKGK